MDIRKIVDHAFPNEKGHVTVQAKMLCCFVHLIHLPDELDKDKQTHQCTESDLDSSYNLGPNGRRVLHHAKRNVKHLSGTAYVIGRTGNSLLYSVRDTEPRFTHLRARSEC